MLIRPYTISQIAILLLLGFFLAYLLNARRCAPAADRAHIEWMLQVVGWGAILTLITTIIGVVENPSIDVIVYFREVFVMLFWHALNQALYALPPVEPFAQRREPRYVGVVFVTLIVLELGFLAFRLLQFSQTATLERHDLLLVTPLFLAGLWSALLVMRKLWAAERAPGAAFTATLRRALIKPQSRIGRFYRALSLAVSGLALLIVFFNVVRFTDESRPVWFMISSDLLVTGAIMLALFGYLSASPVLASLKFQLVGAGLTLFFALIAAVGWIVAVTFLGQQAPQVSPANVFGTQVEAQFFVTPAAYSELAQQLSDLLAPLLWFTVVSSFLFVLAYIFYFDRVLHPPLRQIIESFHKVEQGELAVRIPPPPWQDEFSQIVASFNQMAASLEHTDQELRAHQEHLQALVDQRTAELMQEMNLRKELEVRQAIQDERTRIAQETHDGLLQSLMGVGIRLNRSERLSHLPAERRHKELDEITNEITHATQDLRHLINELNDQILSAGLLPALQQIIQRQQRAYAIEIQADLNYPPALLAVNQELHILRIVQEALANAARHSGAAHICVTVACTEAEGGSVLKVQIRDDGEGFDPSQLRDGGWGLKNMQRRASQVNGRLHIDSRPGVGTVIELTVPLHRHTASQEAPA